MKTTLATLLLLLTASLCWGQAVTLTIGNVDTVERSTYQAINPSDPTGPPITVTRVGLEYHVMNFETGDAQIEGRYFFWTLWDDGADDGARNITNCV